MQLSSTRDNIEIGMRFDHLLVEAKLTQSDLQSARLDFICRYRDFDIVFELSNLPCRNGRYGSYQLIEGTLAAHATCCSFCVFCDARSPDLIKQWYLVMRAVRICKLRCHLMLLTWQQLAAALPSDLQQLLAAKYGVIPT